MGTFVGAVVVRHLSGPARLLHALSGPFPLRRRQGHGRHSERSFTGKRWLSSLRAVSGASPPPTSARVKRASARVTAVPPSSATFLSLLLAPKPIQRAAGEKNLHVGARDSGAALPTAGWRCETPGVISPRSSFRSPSGDGHGSTPSDRVCLVRHRRCVRTR